MVDRAARKEKEIHSFRVPQRIGAERFKGRSTHFGIEGNRVLGYPKSVHVSKIGTRH